MRQRRSERESYSFRKPSDSAGKSLDIFLEPKPGLTRGIGVDRQLKVSQPQRKCGAVKIRFLFPGIPPAGMGFFFFRVFICDFFGLSDVSSFLVVVIRMELRCEILLISLFELIDRGVLKRRRKKLSDFSSQGVAVLGERYVLMCASYSKSRYLRHFGTDHFVIE